MKLFKSLIIASAALALISSAALANGIFEGYPAATSPLTGNEQIPADTNLGQGLTPQTETVSPAQIIGVGNASLAPTKVTTVPVGSVAYASFGTSTATVAGTIYLAPVNVVSTTTFTGIGVLNGATVGTDNLIFALYNSSGALVANTALAGTLSAGASAFQQIAFTATYQAIGPGRYWIAVQGNGTTATIRTVATATFVNILGGSQTGVFATLPATITPPTTFTADKAPIAYLY